jgi:hypothetical protein
LSAGGRRRDREALLARRKLAPRSGARQAADMRAGGFSLATLRALATGALAIAG